MFMLIIKGARGDHEASVSGIYLMRKSVEVEILLLMRIIHLSKAGMLREYDAMGNEIDTYKRLSRYIRLMSGVQALLYHPLHNKTSCNT